jgi:hypothetical protein
MRQMWVLMLCFILLSLCMQAQNEPPVTNKTDSKVRVKRDKSEKPEGKQYMLIYHKNTKGILYGNPCMMEVTRKMGFEYAVAPKGTKGNRTEFGRRMHNFGVKSVLTAKNPFWRSKVKRKLKECRQKTGDFTG